MPTQKDVESWAEQVPQSFRFVLKARQAITHFKRLQNAEKETDDFLEVASLLRGRLGPILFQLPPNFKKNVERLDALLKHIAGRVKVAFEFRNATWLDGEVYDCLRAHLAVACFEDRDDMPETSVVQTADWGYVRLWGGSYSDEQLRGWVKRVRSHEWADFYVIFTHKDAGYTDQSAGIAPKLASRFKELAGA